MRTTILTILAASALWAQAPATKLDCADVRSSMNDLVRYCEMREVSLPFTGTSLPATLDGSGTITAQSWDGTEVIVRTRVVTFGENLAHAESLAPQVVVDTADGNVRVSGFRGSSRQGWLASLEILVPREAGVSTSILNGNTTMSGIKGDLSVVSTIGNISVKDAEGAVRFTSTNGNVTLEGVSGSIEGRSTNGIIQVTVGKWTGQTIDVKTVNGGIELEVPHDTAAHVALSVALGSLVSNVGTVKSGIFGIGMSAAFDLGGGGPSIRASLINGYLRFKRAE